jgi:hypothetical protein
MGNSGMKRKGRQHLPKVGSKPENNYAIRHERQAVEENLGLRPGGIPAKIVGGLVILVAIVAVIALIVLN